MARRGSQYLLQQARPDVLALDRIMKLQPWELRELAASRTFEKMPFPHRLWMIGPTLCAFSNSSGGVLVLGINRNGIMVGFGISHQQHMASFSESKRKLEDKVCSLLLGEPEIDIQWKSIKNRHEQDDYLVLIRVLPSGKGTVVTKRRYRAYVREGANNRLIASGIHDPQSRRVRAVYNMPSTRFEEDCPEKENEMLKTQVRQDERKPVVFVSHSSDDAMYADEFVKLLRCMGLSRKNLIYTSNTDLGVPLGNDIFDFLKNCFTDYNLYVIFLVSKDNYYASPYCLNEMGAAWVVGSACCPVLLPGTSFEDLRGVLRSSTSAISLDQPARAKYLLGNLRHDVVAHTGAEDSGDAFWEQERDDFLRKVIAMSSKFKGV